MSSSPVPVITLDLQQHASLEIEVPAGEWQYFFSLTTPTKPQPALPQRTLRFHLRHPETHLALSGLVQAVGEDASELTVELSHHAPHTYAHTTIHTLAQDSAYPHFEGMIRIRPAAQGSESYLTHHSLLIGQTAASWSRPSLEILNDEVKCSHSATIRTLSDEDRWYMTSRGIPPNLADRALIQAFIKEVQPNKNPAVTAGSSNRLPLTDDETEKDRYVAV